ncbi:MAG: MurT ligase domain-containing protein [Candidatus Daviesbacteria bacterium]|nr:MurT ligase domain-containing protein [Candidatus Daviesbacteria bacterium]
MRLIFAILLGKLIAYFTRILKIGGGSAAPGLFALKIDPDLVKKLSSKISQNIVITGTNGKTTTAKMLAHFAKASGLKVIRNHTGSNLERGIASTLILRSHLTSGKLEKLDYDLGIWELDEAAFNSIAPKLKPKAVVILNLSRDQLDRYGETDKIVNDWCQTLKKLSPDTNLLINKDDKNLAKLKFCFGGKMLKFGLPANIKLNGLNGSIFQFTVHSSQFTVNLPLPGVYHIYDTVAALTTANALRMPINSCIESLKTFNPAFGRVEKLPFGYIFLIKNPAGATQVFETIAPNIKPLDRLLLALNNNLADGTDVSWIWDAGFERLQVTGYRLQVIASGTRAHDLALRLKYAGFDPKQIIIEPDLKKALEQAREGLKGRLFILPTYTAMLELQSILTKSGIKKHYWKEDA